MDTISLLWFTIGILVYGSILLLFLMIIKSDKEINKLKKQVKDLQEDVDLFL